MQMLMPNGISHTCWKVYLSKLAGQENVFAQVLFIGKYFVTF